jgi:hypothetical protein
LIVNGNNIQKDLSESDVFQNERKLITSSSVPDQDFFSLGQPNFQYRDPSVSSSTTNEPIMSDLY